MRTLNRVVGRGVVGGALIAAALAGCARGSGQSGQVAKTVSGEAAHVRVTPIGEHRTGATVALAEVSGRRLAFVADDDDSVIHAVDLSTHAELSATSLPGAPAQILVAKDGRVFATLRDRSELVVLEVVSDDGTLRIRTTVPTAADPVGLAMSPNDATLLVTCGWGHEMAVLDAKTLKPTFRVDLPREPRAVVVSDDGSKAYVSHSVGSALTVVNLTGERKAKIVSMDSREDITLQPDLGKRGVSIRNDSEKRTRTACQGYALAKATDPNGRIFAPQVLVDAGDPEQSSDGYGSGSEASEVGNIAVLDATSGEVIGASLATERTGTAIDGGEARDCVLPRAAVADPGSRSLYVSCLGIDSVVEYDATSVDPHASEKRRWAVPGGPTGMAIDPASHRLVVWSQFDRTLTSFSLTESATPLPSEARRQVALSRKASSSEGDVALGRKLFHAAGDKRISADGRACASCHPDGRDDSLTWATPDGPRQSIMLAGRLDGTAPFGWNGAGKDVKTHLKHTFERLRGEGLDQAHSDALVAYIRSMKAPDRSARTEPLAKRGDELFHSAATGCTTCHADGKAFSDGKSHDVKSKVDVDQNEGFDTPSLRFIGGTAPYFHDGRYKTLRELLVSSDGKMGHTKHLAPADVDALEAYLRTLVIAGPVILTLLPVFASLPEATVPEVVSMRTAPESIAASERIDGLYVASIARYVRAPMILSTVTVDERCLHRIEPSGEVDGGVSTLQFIRAPGVVGLRSERIVGKGDSAKLEVVDGYIDTRSRGARMTKTTLVPLKPIAHGPPGVVVYAYRQGTTLELVVTTQPGLLFTAPGHLQETSMPCNLAHIPMDTAAPEGRMAVVKGNVELTAPSTWGRENTASKSYDMRLVVSTSRTKQDAAPLISVSMQWKSLEEAEETVVPPVEELR